MRQTQSPKSQQAAAEGREALEGNLHQPAARQGGARRRARCADSAPTCRTCAPLVSQQTRNPLARPLPLPMPPLPEEFEISFRSAQRIVHDVAARDHPRRRFRRRHGHHALHGLPLARWRTRRSAEVAAQEDYGRAMERCREAFKGGRLVPFVRVRDGRVAAATRRRDGAAIPTRIEGPARPAR